MHGTHSPGYAFSAVKLYLSAPCFKLAPLGRGGRPSLPRLSSALPFPPAKYAARPVSPSFFACTSSLVPSSPISSFLGALALPTLSRPTTSACDTTEARAYPRRASRFQYGLSAMSAAGRVTGSVYARGSFDPGGGLRNWGFRGTPLDRFGSTASVRRILSQIPVDCRVYFYPSRSVSWLFYERGPPATWAKSACSWLAWRWPYLVDSDYSARSFYSLGGLLRRHVGPWLTSQWSIDFVVRLEVLEFERDLKSALVRPHD